MGKKNPEGELDKAKGKIKETVGVATGDRELEGEGKLDNLKGKVKDVAGNIREGIKEKLDDPAVRGNSILLRRRVQGGLDQVLESDLFLLQVVAVLEEALDGEEIFNETAHAPQRPERNVDHLFRALAAAIGGVHPLEQIAGPERRRERVLDFMCDEPEVLPALSRRRHRPNLSAGTRVRKRTAAQELQVMQPSGHGDLTGSGYVHSTSWCQVPVNRGRA